jgi:dUTP pyrophosphatase
MKQIVKVKTQSKHPLPVYETLGSAGMDLRADLNESIVLNPMERILVPTGLFMEIPLGYEGQVRPRSGLAIKHGISLINCVGTIDSDYRGELKVPVINLGTEPFVIKDGERIAQFVLSMHGIVEWSLKDNLNETERGKGGFGSTGK